MAYRYRPDYPTSFRLPRELRGWLVRYAQTHNYHLSQAIIYVLEQGRKKIDPKSLKKKKMLAAAEYEEPK